MYIPTHFKVEDPNALGRLIQEYGFGTLVTVMNGAPFASHLPFLFDGSCGANGALLGHMARANPQWHHFESGNDILAMFQGPHGYISPSWYFTSPSVPTWNYAAVHVYGIPRVVEGDELLAILRKTVAAYEANRDEPWLMASLPDEYVEKMARGIVGFEIEITRIEGKFKLSQNRSAEDVENVVAELHNLGDAASMALAKAMRGQGSGIRSLGTEGAGEGV